MNARTTAHTLLTRHSIQVAQLRDLLRKSEELEQALTRHVHELEDEENERRRDPAA